MNVYVVNVQTMNGRERTDDAQAVERVKFNPRRFSWIFLPRWLSCVCSSLMTKPWGIMKTSKNECLDRKTKDFIIHVSTFRLVDFCLQCSLILAKWSRLFYSRMVKGSYFKVSCTAHKWFSMTSCVRLRCLCSKLHYGSVFFRLSERFRSFFRGQFECRGAALPLGAASETFRS